MTARRRTAAALCAVLLSASACSSSGAGSPATPTPTLTTPAVTHSSPAPIKVPARTSSAVSTPAPTTSTAKPTRTSSAPPETTTSSHSVAPPPPSSGAPVIVIDPGHSPGSSGTDPKTGLDLADYENEPEMQDVFAVSLLVRAKLQADGYKVILTKSSADDRVNLGQRAAVANDAHADLALSIHDQAGSNGGLAFDSANNNVYYQADGDYRTNPQGHNVVFDNPSLAATSKKYGEIFQQQRQAVEHHPVRVLSNTGYNLGSRGLQAGNIWIVQLLSTVPWIYNEAGGNSAGQSGLNSADKATYAAGIVAGVEHCIAPPR